MKSGWKLILLALAAVAAVGMPAYAKECRDEAITATSREYLSRSLGAFPGSWQLLSATNTAWGTVTNRSVSPTHSAYCAGGGDAAPVGGPYQNDLQTWMVYGPFSLADATAASTALPPPGSRTGWRSSQTRSRTSWPSSLTHRWAHGPSSSTTRPRHRPWRS